MFTCVLSVAVAKKKPISRDTCSDTHTAARRKTSEISPFVYCSYQRIGDGLSRSVRAVVVVVDEIDRERQRDKERERDKAREEYCC